MALGPSRGILPFCSGGNQPQRTIRGPTRKVQRESTTRPQIPQPLKTSKAINKEPSPKAPILNQHDSTRREPCQPLFSKGWLKANGTHVKTDMPHQPDADKRCPPSKRQRTAFLISPRFPQAQGFVRLLLPGMLRYLFVSCFPHVCIQLTSSFQ